MLVGVADPARDRIAGAERRRAARPHRGPHLVERVEVVGARRAPAGQAIEHLPPQHVGGAAHRTVGEVSEAGHRADP